MIIYELIKGTWWVYKVYISEGDDGPINYEIEHM